MRLASPPLSSFSLLLRLTWWKVIFISFRWYWTRVWTSKPEKCKSFDTYVSKERTKRTWQRTRFQLLVRRLMKSRSIKFDTAPTILRALTIRWINANYRDGYSMLCVCVCVCTRIPSSVRFQLPASRCLDDVYPRGIAIARSSRSR